MRNECVSTVVYLCCTVPCPPCSLLHPYDFNPPCNTSRDQKVCGGGMNESKDSCCVFIPHKLHLLIIYLYFQVWTQKWAKVVNKLGCNNTLFSIIKLYGSTLQEEGQQARSKTWKQLGQQVNMHAHLGWRLEFLRGVPRRSLLSSAF